jgi:hypothetical protein
MGNQLGEQFEPLGYQIEAEDAEARDIAARPAETNN